MSWWDRLPPPRAAVTRHAHLRAASAAARREDGSLRYDMKKVWRDGTHAIVLAPLDLIARLCAMLVSLEPQSRPSSVGHRGPALKGHVTHAELSMSAVDVALTL